MITLGIDLASQANKTGVARLRWTKAEGAPRVAVETLRVGADDDALVALARDADAIGIDSPFGWPRAFEKAGNQASAGEWRWCVTPSPPPRKALSAIKRIRR